MGKIYLQMYSFMDGEHNDSRENLQLAAKMGYDGVELFGPNFEIPAAEMKQLLDELGLEAVSVHVPGKDSVSELIPYVKEIGCRFLGIGMEIMKNDAEVHAWASRLNELGRLCSENGLLLTYHNHTQEFLPCEDARVIDVLMRETDPALVGFELDAGWCAAAGADPVEFVKKYSGRVKLLHVKESSEAIGPQPPMDFSGFEKDEDGRIVFPDDVKAAMDRDKKINCPACEGLVDWKIMTETADANGCCAHIVEREYSKGDRIEELTNDIRRYREVM